MKEMKKQKIVILIFIVILLIVLFIILKQNIFAPKAKDVFEKFFPGATDYKAVELFDSNGQTYTIDDYSMELKESLYDSKTGIGYLMFVISKEGGKPEIELDVANQKDGFGFGENERFNFNLSVAFDDVCEYIGDDLYAYISFQRENDDEVQVTIADSLENKVYSYEIKETEKVRAYKLDEDDMLYISPLGISIMANQRYSDLVIKLHMKDGDEKEIVNVEKRIGTAGSSESIITNQHSISCEHKFVLKEMLDISEIETIEVNGGVLEEK